MTQALTIPTPASPAQAIEFGVGAWIYEKFGHTKSEKTRMAYTETITAFRQRSSKTTLWSPVTLRPVSADVIWSLWQSQERE